MRKPKAPKVVALAVITTATIVFWVFYGLYLTLTQRQPLAVEETVLSPLSSTLDTSVLNDLQGRTYFEKGQTTSIEIQSDQALDNVSLTPAAGSTEEVAE
jgi:hypothetical protein